MIFGDRAIDRRDRRRRSRGSRIDAAAKRLGGRWCLSLNIPTTTVAKTVATTSRIITLIMNNPPIFALPFAQTAWHELGKGSYCAADTAEVPL